MDRYANMIPSSPTASSLSSSDLDTESTGSFFPDRSTSLGSLMGVTFPDLSSVRSTNPTVTPLPPCPRVSTRNPRSSSSSSSAVGAIGVRERRPTTTSRSRSRWWIFCREEDMARRTSLGDFLQVERRLSYGGGDDHGWYVGMAEHEVVGGVPLFEDGRVLPPPPPLTTRRREQARDGASGALIRLPVLLSGICSGGEG